jgi:4'-phosphopantetheinyl transferase
MGKMVSIFDVFLLYKGKQEKACIGVCTYTKESNLLEDVVPNLHPFEIKYLEKIRVEKRRNDYLMGRCAAKHAVMKLKNLSCQTDFYITNGFFRQPIVYGQDVQVSLSHTEGVGVAVAFSKECIIGIDIEVVKKDNNDILQRVFTDHEKEIVKSFGLKQSIISTMIWSLKEAMSKALRIGFTTSPKLFEVYSMKEEDNCFFCKFTNFTQFQARTYVKQNKVFALVYPFQTELQIEAITE